MVMNIYPYAYQAYIEKINLILFCGFDTNKNRTRVISHHRKTCQNNSMFNSIPQPIILEFPLITQLMTTFMIELIINVVNMPYWA